MFEYKLQIYILLDGKTHTSRIKKIITLKKNNVSNFILHANDNCRSTRITYITLAKKMPHVNKGACITNLVS